MPDEIAISLRWLHIASMTTLLGGIVFWRMVLARAGVDDTRGAFTERIAAAFRPLVFTSIAGLLISGFINFLAAPGHSKQYHMLFGIKLLLALHVFAVSILIVQPNNPRRTRMATGTMLSGLAILLISAWLRRNF
jgi:cytochrome bd-type quinol oxidase subunit 2